MHHLLEIFLYKTRPSNKIPYEEVMTNPEYARLKQAMEEARDIPIEKLRDPIKFEKSILSTANLRTAEQYRADPNTPINIVVGAILERLVELDSQLTLKVVQQIIETWEKLQIEANQPLELAEAA